VTEPRKLAADQRRGLLAAPLSDSTVSASRQPRLLAPARMGLYGPGGRSSVFGAAHRPISRDVELCYRARLILSCEAGMETAKVVISVQPDRREGGYGLQASKIGVADRIDGYANAARSFTWLIALPPSMRPREAAPVWGDQGGSACRIRSLRRGGIEDGQYVEADTKSWS
jgi:hypothetical protein